ncbi:hypothetical protein C8J57DRAFT_1234432 [Mycena rebaudengoi]|nr:hypothetical protein C8J57DRAFT_1234432 [Mycena rebaudengoi]
MARGNRRHIPAEQKHNSRLAACPRYIPTALHRCRHNEAALWQWFGGEDGDVFFAILSKSSPNHHLVKIRRRILFIWWHLQQLPPHIQTENSRQVVPQTLSMAHEHIPRFHETRRTEFSPYILQCRGWPRERKHRTRQLPHACGKMELAHAAHCRGHAS